MLCVKRLRKRLRLRRWLAQPPRLSHYVLHVKRMGLQVQGRGQGLGQGLKLLHLQRWLRRRRPSRLSLKRMGLQVQGQGLGWKQPPRLPYHDVHPQRPHQGLKRSLLQNLLHKPFLGPAKAQAHKVPCSQL